MLMTDQVIKFKSDRIILIDKNEGLKKENSSRLQNEDRLKSENKILFDKLEEAQKRL